MKKILSLILVIVLLAGIAPAALAADNVDYAAVRAELSQLAEDMGFEQGEWKEGIGYDGDTLAPTLNSEYVTCYMDNSRAYCFFWISYVKSTVSVGFGNGKDYEYDSKEFRIGGSVYATAKALLTELMDRYPIDFTSNFDYEGISTFENVIKPYALSVGYDRCTSAKSSYDGNPIDIYSLYFDNQKLVVIPLPGETECSGWYLTRVYDADDTSYLLMAFDTQDNLTQLKQAISDALPSDWAKDEIEKAVDLGFTEVGSLGQKYRFEINRMEAALLFTAIIEKLSGMSIEDYVVSKGLSINRNVFSDIDWMQTAACHALGIVSGTGNGKFSPEDYLTRAQFAAMMNRTARLFGVSTDNYIHSFTDVKGHWVDKELGWPSSVGIISGIGGGLFSPDTVLTKEQALAMAVRAYDVLK